MKVQNQQYDSLLDDPPDDAQGHPALGQWVMQARKSLNYSRDELAARSGVSAKTIQRIEDGADAQHSTVLSLAQALHIALVALPQAQVGYVADVLANQGRLLALPAQRSAPPSRLGSAMEALANAPAATSQRNS